MHVDRRIASRLSRCHPYKPPQKSPCYFRQSFLHQEGNLKVEPSRSQYLDKDESRNRTREPDHERGCRAPRQPDRHCAKRRGGTVPFRRFLVPRRETTGRDCPYSSFRPICGGAAAQGQMRGRPIKQEGRRDRAYQQKTGRPARFCGDARSRRGRAARQNKKGPPRVSPGRASAHARENAPCWPAASCSPTDYTAVPSALGGLTSGFGTGPGVPPLPWPPANKGRSHPPAPPVRALRAAQRSKASLQGRDRDRMPSPRRREGE